MSSFVSVSTYTDMKGDAEHNFLGILTSICHTLSIVLPLFKYINTWKPLTSLRCSVHKMHIRMVMVNAER